METTIVILSIFTLIAIIGCYLLQKLLYTRKKEAEAKILLNKRESDEILEKAETERRELNLLLNAFDDALVIMNQSGIILVANKAANALCRGRRLKGNTISAAFLDHQICQHLKQIIQKNETSKEKIILHNSSFGQPNTNHTSNIEDSAWIIDYAPLYLYSSKENSKEDPLHRIILRNVTSEHRTDLVKRDFVANASHELRTPLAIISGYIENLIDNDVIEEPTVSRKILGTMRKHSDRIAQLIEEMLIISKLESETGSLLNHETFSLNDTLITISERLAPLIHKQNASLTTRFKPKEISINGDSFYWEQTLYNLIENALKQNAKTPIQIQVNSSIQNLKNQQQLVITITDNGKGIPSKHLPYIFNRFYRVQTHHSQNEIKGTGLGLSIVKNAIEAHGGTISASSIPGIETTFKIVLPQKHQ